MASHNFSLKITDVKLTSTNTVRSSLNETEGIVDRYTLTVPAYLYREIPTAFETLGIILNITIIVYFIKSGKYRTPIFTILTCLAATDTCVCLGAAMAILITPSVLIPEGGFMCALGLCILVIGILGSEHTLIFFAGVRLYQVTEPLKARASITMGLVLKYCATIITVSIGLSLLYSVFWRQATMFVDGEDITVCIFIGDAYITNLVLLIVCTVIPCFVIFLLHLLKYFAYVRSKRLVETKHERKSPDAYVVAIVIILFYICWIPAMTYQTLQHFRTDDYAIIEDKVFLVLMHVAYANSIMNPIVYVLAMKSIRDDFIMLFCFRKQAN